ncbi:peptidoglycan glycosyltransferase [Humidesulfovibrio mexicanus]|uniref:Peptidoglycan glycosyltransferase n=1 Tax=Humidesulfovibrio mexicanus TaxID=147047 RepID=A0A239CIU6_9BACT|nr:penicillin-binding protein 2 [Humidesulfovibrio mexicanus]SNS20060.1 peptidoglycan glycosyltransferase [Humidesulfovibrio mexicanus]
MKNLLSGSSQNMPRHGATLLQFLVLGLFCLFLVRLWYLQIHLGPVFTEKSRNNQLRIEYLFAPRGFLRDRNGELLAVNEPAFALGLVREDCDDIPATLAKVSELTDIPLERLQEIYARNKPKVKSFEPLVLVPDLNFETIAKIEGMSVRWPGLEILSRTRRKYNYGHLLSHVLGYVSEANESEMQADPTLSLGDFVGKQGLENRLDSRLRGAKGKRLIEVDVTGRRLSEEQQGEPKAGEEVFLSIDLGLQQLGHKMLEGKSGAVIVMDPDSGEVHALVSEPSYDSNMFTNGLSSAQWAQLRDDPLHPLQNRATQSVYPPGSVFKLIIAAAGLHYGVVDPKDTVTCTGEVALGSHVFRCWKHSGHGTVDMRRALVESCDVYFYRLGMKLGVDRMSAFAKACGFGSPTGIDLPHEKGGLIASREWKLKRFGVRWTKGEDLNMSIGQGYTVTSPLQVARYIAAVLNGGKLLKPSLIKGEPATVTGQIPLTPQQAELVKQAMVATVEDPRGTCHRVLTPGVVVGAKTGSAQVVRLTEELRRMGDSVPYKYRDHAWMAGFGEQGGKRYVVVAMVEHGMHGASGAGPVVKAMLNALFLGKRELPPQDIAGAESPAESPAARLEAVETQFPEPPQPMPPSFGGDRPAQEPLRPGPSEQEAPQ